MLPKKFRLPSDSIQLRNPINMQHGVFLIKKTPNAFGHRRVGVLISKKVSTSSPRRHRIKRIILEGVRLYWNLSKEEDVLFIVSSSILRFSREKIMEIVKKAD
ncbi:MAG: hypothetical protein A2586_01525 [Candidatus Harrisonbacteria bacterium RIFOXYD1_FULL_40_9]|uniref:Uncharacterized protein n=1 Tax=Candidatus Harrisonbacteria bacterium RIFOXYD1_FULL_40_9 TaxID=1798412 RepID=A0A1G1ZYN4_9BACT|nr:MAG: hypothetical protein A2586_01525 [Candidatus Harrisonbacteria bacterium RIFOXYD1_FULL_40_9]